MYGAVLKAAVYLPVWYLLVQVLKPFLAEAVVIMQAGPHTDSLTLRAVETVEANLLLLGIISILVMVLGRAVVEKRLPGV